MKNKKKIQIMTGGRILPQLFMFALPLLGSSLVQQLYNTADLLFVGNFAGKAAAAAVGSSSKIFTCLIGLFTGISVGVGIVIAHDWGAEKKKEASATAHTAIVVGSVGSLILMIIGLLLARNILLVLQTPEEIMEDAVRYVRIYFMSMLPMVLYNMGASILRSSGDSKVPFYILIGGGVANVLADVLLVAVFRLGVAGAAVATSISQTVAAVCMMCYLMSRHSRIRLYVKKLRINWQLFGRIMHYGLPSGVQSIVVTLSNVIVQYYINGYGEDAVAAYAAYFKLEDLLYLPIMACAQALTTFVGQNYGACKYDRIRRGTIIGMGMGCGVAIVIASLLLMIPQMIVGLFLRDDTVITYGVSIIMTTFPFYWVYAIVETAGSVLRGMGKTLVSMAVVLLGLCGLRIVLLYILNNMNMTFRTVARVYPITWSVTAVAFCAILVYMQKKRFPRGT